MSRPGIGYSAREQRGHASSRRTSVGPLTKCKTPSPTRRRRHVRDIRLPHSRRPPPRTSALEAPACTIGRSSALMTSAARRRGGRLLLRRLGKLLPSLGELALSSCSRSAGALRGCALGTHARVCLRSGRTKVATARSALRPLARQGHLVGTVTGPLPVEEVPPAKDGGPSNPNRTAL